MNDVVNNLLSQATSKAGGLGDLVSKFSKNGLSQVQSWVGHGENQPASADQVRQALGDEQVGQLAQQSGTTPDDAAAQLAQHLPGAVDNLTPEGAVPEPDKLKGLLGKLTGKL